MPVVIPLLRPYGSNGRLSRSGHQCGWILLIRSGDSCIVRAGFALPSLPLIHNEHKRAIMPDLPKSLKQHAGSLRNPAWIAFVWFGMTAGISLLETPVKFTAPTVTREVALDVGRVVFAALNQAEFVALILLLILVRISGRARQLLLVCGALAAIQIAQAAWLLPELSARTQQIIEGVEP